MPRGIKGSGPAKKKVATRRKRATLEIEEPKFSGLISNDEQYVRRESINIATQLHAGKSIQLDTLLRDAAKIADFLLGLAPATKPIAEEVVPELAPISLDPPESNHKSRFEQITM